ncbi:MAG: type II toxin-antitoxin system RelE/ParE family toxin [Gammaproteobacteria bacterium]|nr:type II toxin-antitoxin system RelE/ParE family toxin [Gammaproteobacteria bacterium]
MSYKKYRITFRAQNDLLDIGRYTEQNWGRKQRNKYLKELESRFLWLTENSQLGKHRSDIHKDYYSYPQGHHVVFYLISNNFIDIIGLPHKEMDILNYFQ